MMLGGIAAQPTGMAMHKRQYIQDIATNMEVSGLFLVAGAALSQSRNGPFWRLDLRDRTGEIEAKIWSPLSREFPEIVPGWIVDAEGRAALYRERLEVTIGRIRVLEDAETARLDLGEFMAASPRPAREMYEELLTLCKQELKYTPWRKFTLSVLHDETVVPLLLAAPAAKTVHHAYAGGLLEHTLSVAKMSLCIAGQYPEMDRQILFVAALFHDLGKIWELTGGLVNDYSDEGRLIGHIELALAYLTPRLEQAGIEKSLALHFRHILLSHHGEYEYGSPRRPKTAEAFALHHADNLDAKIAQSRAALAHITEDAEGWSPYQATLQRMLYKPGHTPEEGTAKPRERAAKNPIEEPCPPAPPQIRAGQSLPASLPGGPLTLPGLAVPGNMKDGRPRTADGND